MRLTPEHLVGTSEADLAAIGRECLHELGSAWYRIYPTDRHGLGPVLATTKRWLDDPSSVNWTDHAAAVAGIEDPMREAYHDANEGHIAREDRHVALCAAAGCRYLLWVGHRDLAATRLKPSRLWLSWATMYACAISTLRREPVCLAADGVTGGADPIIGPVALSMLQSGLHDRFTDALAAAIEIVDLSNDF